MTGVAPRRLRSLRWAALGAVLASGAITPLWIVAIAPKTDGWEDRTRGRAVEAARLAAESGPKTPVMDAPGARTTWVEADDNSAPEIVQARLEGSASACAWDRGVFHCAAAQRMADGRVAHVLLGATGADVALWQHRSALFGLAGVSTLIGASMALWVGFRLVRPVEALRDEVVARAADPRRMEPLHWTRPDELGDLAGAVDQLVLAVRTRDAAHLAFAADLAHELRNPLSAVQAASELLTSSADPHATRVAAALADAVQRLEAVTGAFLELARAEAGLPGREHVQVALHELVGAVVRSTRADVRTSRIEVEFTSVPVLVMGDPERIETALRNLVANAMAFATRRVTITVRAELVAILEVTDDGCGLDEEAASHVFERWFSRRPGGTGLGLPLARAIAEAHGGSIALHSRPREGATFVFSLPLFFPSHPLAGPTPGGFQ